MSSPPGALPELPAAARAIRLAGLLSVLAVLWWTLSEGRASTWYVGAPAIVLTALALARTGPLGSPRFNPLAALRFAGFFIRASLVGGVDVAARVLGPELRIRPGVKRYRWRLPAGGSRVLAIATLCLQPGTLAVRDEDGVVEVHLLDRSMDLEVSMWELESLIAAMVGVDLRSLEDGG